MKFSVGEKVIIYWGGQRNVGHISKDISPHKYLVSVQLECVLTYVEAHEKQLRRIKPKAKKLKVEFECEWFKNDYYITPSNIFEILGVAKIEELIGKKTKVTVIEL